jgi:hypothetical protein
MPQGALSVHELKEQILIALAEAPGKQLDVKQLIESKGFKYQEGLIAMATDIMIEMGWIEVKRTFKHLRSGVDDEICAAITGPGFIEAEKLKGRAIKTRQKGRQFVGNKGFSQ